MLARSTLPKYRPEIDALELMSVATMSWQVLRHRGAPSIAEMVTRVGHQPSKGFRSNGPIRRQSRLRVWPRRALDLNDHGRLASDAGSRSASARNTPRCNHPGTQRSYQVAP